MKSLYEGILDTDKKIIKQNKTILLRRFCEIVCEVLPDMHIVFTIKQTRKLFYFQSNR